MLSPRHGARPLAPGGRAPARAIDDDALVFRIEFHVVDEDDDTRA